MKLIRQMVEGLAPSACQLMLRPSVAAVGDQRDRVRASFYTLLLTGPYFLFSIFIVDEVYRDRYGVAVDDYILTRLGEWALSYPLTFLLVGLQLGFDRHSCERWIGAYNWMNLLLALLLLPVFLVSLLPGWSREALIVMGTGTYFFILYAYWAMSWSLGLKNPFACAGLALAPVFVADMLSNLSNYRMFGHIRPFFAGS